MSKTSCNVPYIIQDVPFKGNGLVATTKIPRGTRILSESPLCTVPFGSRDTTQYRDAILDAVCALTQEERTEFFLLRNSHARFGDVVGRFRTNAFPLGLDKTEVGIFLDSSRLNHSCIPNAHFNWNGKKLTVHALRDIAEVEEITILYRGGPQNREARLELLWKESGFNCACTLCSLPSDLSATSDERCNEIQSIYNTLAAKLELMYTPLQALYKVSRVLELLSDEGFTGKDTLDAFCCAFEIVLSHGDIARAMSFASRAASIRTMLEGGDSPAVKEWLRFAIDPSQYEEAQRVSEAWRTTKDDSPRGLSTEEFESWLWKKGTTEVKTYTDLRTDKAFPLFNALPRCEDASSYHPRGGVWCFLAEIVDFKHSASTLMLQVKDKDHRTVHISCNIENDCGLDRSSVQKGNTVAILRAAQHKFDDSSLGISADNLNLFLVYSYILDLKPPYTKICHSSSH